MEQDEDEVAECDKVRTNIFYLKRGENQSRLDDFSPLRTSAAVSKYRGAENQFPLSKIIISLIAERADKQQWKIFLYIFVMYVYQHKTPLSFYISLAFSITSFKYRVGIEKKKEKQKKSCFFIMWRRETQLNVFINLYFAANRGKTFGHLLLPLLPLRSRLLLQEPRRPPQTSLRGGGDGREWPAGPGRVRQLGAEVLPTQAVRVWPPQAVGAAPKGGGGEVPRRHISSGEVNIISARGKKSTEVYYKTKITKFNWSFLHGYFSR